MAGPDFLIPCAELFARAAERVSVTGPLLPDEARAVHRGFWSRGADIASVAPKPWHLLSRVGGPDAGYVPGSIGRIAELHATYYSAAVGFGAPFEAKVATELAQFCLGYQSGRDGLWLVQQDGVIHGSVAIDGSHHDESGAHLRWFITSDALRGQGAGSQLLAAALAFCDARRYTTVYLWTFDGLRAARHLYKSTASRSREASAARSGARRWTNSCSPGA